MHDERFWAGSRLRQRRGNQGCLGHRPSIALGAFAVIASSAPAAAADPVGAHAPPVSAQHARVQPDPIEPAPERSPASARSEAEPLAVASDAGEPRRRRRHWTDPFGLDVTAATWVPLSMGPEVVLEGPGRVLLQLHLGWMPEFYSQALTNGLEDAGAYDADTAELVDGAVRGATTWRVAAGWRPFPNAGLELTVGYAHVSLDGTTRTTELAPVVAPELAERLLEEVGDARVDLDSSIHHFTLAAGWRFLIAERLVIRANLGYLQAFASDSSLGVPARPDLAALAEPTVQGLLHDQYMRYIKIPVVGLGVGYRFF